MTDLELVVAMSQKFENILKEIFGAKGRGLGEYAKSVAHILPICLINNLLYVAKVRNDLIHSRIPIKSKDTFLRRCDEIEKDLVKINSLYNQIFSLEKKLQEISQKNLKVPSQFDINSSQIVSKSKSNRNQFSTCPNCHAPLKFKGMICEFCVS